VYRQSNTNKHKRAATARWTTLLFGAFAWCASFRAAAQGDIVSPASTLQSINSEPEGNDEITDIAEEPLAAPRRTKATHQVGKKAVPHPSGTMTKATKANKGQAKGHENIAPVLADAGTDDDELADDSAVGSSNESLPDKENSPARQVSGGVRVEDIVEPPSDYRYAAFSKADPFVPPMVTKREPKAIAAAAPANPDALEIPIISPLQRYALSELNVIGIWQLSSGERKAMIMTPQGGGGGGGSSAGQGIIVKVSDAIGNRGGKIQSIGDDFISAREFLLAPDGTRQYEDKLIYMGGGIQDDSSGKIRFTPGSAKTEVMLDNPSNQFGGTNAEGERPLPAPALGGAAEPAAAKDAAGAPAAPIDPKTLAPHQEPPVVPAAAPLPAAALPAPVAGAPAVANPVPTPPKRNVF